MIDNEHALWQASRQYVTGEITHDQLQAIERPAHETFKQALLKLAKRQVRQRWWGKWRKLRGFVFRERK